MIPWNCKFFFSEVLKGGRLDLKPWDLHILRFLGRLYSLILCAGNPVSVFDDVTKQIVLL